MDHINHHKGYKKSHNSKRSKPHYSLGGTQYSSTVCSTNSSCGKLAGRLSQSSMSVSRGTVSSPRGVSRPLSKMSDSRCGFSGIQVQQQAGQYSFSSALQDRKGGCSKNPHCTRLARKNVVRVPHHIPCRRIMNPIKSVRSSVPEAGQLVLIFVLWINGTTVRPQILRDRGLSESVFPMLLKAGKSTSH